IALYTALYAQVVADHQNAHGETFLFVPSLQRRNRRNSNYTFRSVSASGKLCLTLTGLPPHAFAKKGPKKLQLYFPFRFCFRQTAPCPNRAAAARLCKEGTEGTLIN